MKIEYVDGEGMKGQLFVWAIIIFLIIVIVIACWPLFSKAFAGVWDAWTILNKEGSRAEGILISALENVSKEINP